MLNPLDFFIFLRFEDRTHLRSMLYDYTVLTVRIDKIKTIRNPKLVDLERRIIGVLYASVITMGVRSRNLDWNRRMSD